MGQQPEIPEGEFYSRLYVEPGAPRDDSPRFRNRLAANFVNQHYSSLRDYGIPQKIGGAIEEETGYRGFDSYYYGLLRLSI